MNLSTYFKNSFNAMASFKQGENRQVSTADQEEPFIHQTVRQCFGKNKNKNVIISFDFLKVCANPECDRKDGLRSAPLFVCAYFGLDRQKSRRGLCTACFQEAENHQNCK